MHRGADGRRAAAIASFQLLWHAVSIETDRVQPGISDALRFVNNTARHREAAMARLRYRVSEVAAGWVLDEDGRTVAVVASAMGVLDEVYRDIHRHVADLACEMGWVRLHAAVADVRGRRILLVGPSAAGKTTLASALALAGIEVPADESVMIRAGMAIPVARRFHLKPGTEDVVPGLAAFTGSAPAIPSGVRAWDPSTCGMTWSVSARTVDAVVLIRPRRSVATVRPIGAVAAMPAIVAEALRHREPIGTVIAEIATVLGRAPCWELVPASPPETLTALAAMGYGVDRLRAPEGQRS